MTGNMLMVARSLMRRRIFGERTFSYDANGNQMGWEHDRNGTRRTMVWDEENRIQSISDNGQTKTYKYNDAGQRVIKRGPQGETAYVNQFFVIRNREGGTKHIYAGTTRLVSKLMKPDKPGKNPQGKVPLEKDLYYYHPDHLGSSAYVSDTQGKLFQHLEYFPFGETFVEQSSNTQRTPYRFTAKEFDEETGLYYFGARYYDPRTSVWLSPDPILGDYLPNGNIEHDQNLRGMGGVFNAVNLGLYGYVGQSPVRFVDPDGREIKVSKTVGKKRTKYKITFTATLVNKSSTTLTKRQMKKHARRIKSQIQSSFKGKDGNTSWSTKVKINVGTLKNKRHSINLVNSSSFGKKGVLGRVNAIGGSEMKVNVGILGKKPADTGNASFERTSAHEFGHLGGLLHSSGKIMDQTRTSEKMGTTKTQIETMYRKYKAGNLK